MRLMKQALLMLLAALPLACYFYCKLRAPKKLWLSTGIGLGLVISPISMGILALKPIPLVGMLFGLIGIILTLPHDFPGYLMALSTGLAHIGGELPFKERIWVEVLNGIFWSVVYGFIGHALDNRGKN